MEIYEEKKEEKKKMRISSDLSPSEERPFFFLKPTSPPTKRGYNTPHWVTTRIQSRTFRHISFSSQYYIEIYIYSRAMWYYITCTLLQLLEEEKGGGTTEANGEEQIKETQNGHVICNWNFLFTSNPPNDFFFSLFILIDWAKMTFALMNTYWPGGGQLVMTIAKKRYQSKSGSYK